MLKKVQVISKETIKPSSPTPQNLHSLQLSLLDQIAPQIYNHLLLFYSKNPPQALTQLKSSLSKTLTCFYPLAGRIKESKDDNTLYVECNDEGVEFIQARAEAELDSVLLQPPIDQFSELLPIRASDFRYGDPLLRCSSLGSNVVASRGLSMSHLIADGASMAMFLNRWADVARGLDLRPAPRFDSMATFPPRPQFIDQAPKRAQPASGQPAAAIRRFVMSSRAIARLRGGSYDRVHAPTRVEAVSALVLRCLVRARGKKRPVAKHSVNLRRKLSPPLSDESFGNMWISVAAVGKLAVGDGCDDGGGQGLLEEALRNGVRKVDEEYVRRKAEEKWLGRDGMDGVVVGESETWIFSSWCRMPWYQTDFGWGEPEWLGCGIRDMKDVCILVDTKDGDGMEVWLWLRAEEMEKVARDPEFLDFISS
ncbi:LOW QUALITY PROTEIN: salutaridinol 7-O-acetyltransferase-like [Phoenix dactylifera]|uniref:LOW QUALITY PROTEIN: salutaridinol 7-O-acetyltransferase-like n=1 Tax=Phoenix dactylifera TaxID=42345 RepID=A0A8B7CE23_PHODC|nr:LOW QUALITY PROTEIN: salutaridinol 7-O-acetyltransferase-like [Phoenix dactylifera]